MNDDDAQPARTGPKRGAIPTPRHVLAAAMPFSLERVEAIKRTLPTPPPKPSPPPQPPAMVRIPKQYSMWGNYSHGDCVTAEEAFAKACTEVFITDSEVTTWAQSHNVLEGANIHQVMVLMQTQGFQQNGHTYDDGAEILAVDWTNATLLKQALWEGPVKLGVSGDQLDATWWAAGSSEQGGKNWFATGYHTNTSVDHCVCLCGYGSLLWLAETLHVGIPAGVNAEEPGYALFTWDSIGVIDLASLIAITGEAWLRVPTTVTH